MSSVASLSRAKRSFCSGHSMPSGTSLSDSPVPTPRTIRRSAQASRASVENAWATTAG